MTDLTERLATAVADRYAVQHVVGRGGMAIVYLARDLKHDRPVALKVLLPDLAAAIGAERFLSEIRVTANLQHPNILPLFDSGEADGLLFYVMPFVEGESLRQRMDGEKQVAVDEAVGYAVAIASALDYAHRHGVIHRDIKPANILLRDGQVFVTDFGIALAVSGVDEERLTATGLLVGTPQYMSPEQAVGDESLGAASDIYALGSVLYELLTGAPPHTGPTVQAVIAKVLTQEPAPIGAARSGVPLHVEQAVAKALAKAPTDRFASASEFAAALTSAAAPAPSAGGAVLSVSCPSCERDNPCGHRFCDGCGSALEKVCGSCGAAVAPDVAFCGRCGQSSEPGAKPGATMAPQDMVPGVVGASPEPPLTDSERRHATVLHSSVEGYAMLVEHLDADDLERVMDRIHLAAEAIVGKHGGVLNGAAGEELEAIFGVPLAHEDDAHRAVRAALQLQQYVAAVNDELRDATGSALGVRTGISTGFVVARPSRHQGQRFALAGDAVRVAARLTEHAAANHVLVSADTERLLVPFFTTEPLSSFAVSGGGSVITPHRVVGESGVRTRLEGAERNGLTRFAGRDAQMGTLQSCLERSLTGEGQVVSVVGDAGVGKSRLRYEFLHTLDPAAVHVIEGRCESLGATTPYLPFIEALRHVLGLRDGVEHQAESVVDAIRAVDPDLGDFIPIYLHLLSIQSEEHASLEHLKGEDLRLAMSEGLAAVFTVASRQRPVVMLLEDWHWADGASRETLKQLAGIAVAHPLLVVVTARPQGIPDLGQVDHHTTIRLGPLEPSSSIAVICSGLKVDRIADDLGQHLHERTAGNPFFLEELCHAMREEGLLREEEGTMTLTGSVETLQLPDTVQAVLRSRLDRVDPEAREVLRLASVVGREFARDILERALPDATALPSSLEALKSLGMIQQVRVLPEAAYRFKHALTQEAAYESLVQHQRKKLHGLVGEVLEEVQADRAAEQPDIFAHHFSIAERWPAAVRYGRRAAEKACDLSLFAHQSRMLENVHRWVMKLEESDERRKVEIDVLLAWERACETVGNRDQQRTIIDELLSLAEPGTHDRQLAETYIRQGDLLTLLGQFAEAREALDNSLEIWRALSDRVGERNALRSMGFVGWHEGEFEPAIAAAEAALAIDRERKDWEAVAQDLNNLGTVLKGAARTDEALRHYEEAVQLFQEGKLEVGAHFALFMAAGIHRERGELDKAMEYLQKGLAILDRHRLVGQTSFTLTAMAAITHLQGNSEEAIRIYEDVVRRMREIQYATGLTQGLHGLSELLLALGRPREALPYIREKAEVFERMGERSLEGDTRQRLAEIYEQELRDSGAAITEWRKVRALRKGRENLPGEMEAVEGVARLTRRTGTDAAAVIALYQDALHLAVELDDAPKQGNLLNTLGVIRWEQGDNAEALACYERALEIFRDRGDQVHVGLVLNSIGAVLRDGRRFEEALEPLHEALETNRQTRQRSLEGHSLATMGDVYAAIGKPNEALVQYEASLQLRKDLEDRDGEGWMLFRIAQVEASRDQWDRALDFAGQARKIADECADEKLTAACERL
jgi:tetratricopeptide (TPR) repeat protein/class 3 adenylate cyclase/tRNA A-37 threonylcarbamoyl transferase component Bud32